MSKTILNKVGTVALVAIMATPFAAKAESNFVTGTGALNTSAKVDFQILIPKFLTLQVGSTGGTIDEITFAPTATDLINGTAVNGTGGNSGASGVTTIVRGNNGTVSLSADTTAALSNGTGDSIDWTQITTVSTNAAGLPAPTLVNGLGTAVAVVANLAGGRVTNQTATWTYQFLNSIVAPQGTYTGQVTYTASMP